MVSTDIHEPTGTTPTSPNERKRRGARRTARTMAQGLWSDGRVALAAVVALAVVAGLVAGLLTPRGPVTTVEALVTMSAALAVGVLAGLVLGRRWSLLVTPAAFALVFELARIGLDGPSVDGIHLGSIFGAAAFVAGRGMHALLALLPMIVGSVYGTAVASRLGHLTATRPGVVGRTATGLVTLGLILLAVLIARPAATAPILSPDGQPRDGSIAELTTVSIGGHDQTLMIRGTSTDSPVLLHLAGGPGGTDIGAMRLDTGLEQHFVVATWDQPGTGKSYAAIDPTDTLTLDRMVADTLEVTDYLRTRFGQDKIILAGQSWGSLLGVLAVHEAPDRYHAFVGTGQMVDVTATDRIFYDDTLAWAQQTGNHDLAAALVSNGPPPYDDLLRYTLTVGYERELNPYPEFDGHTEMTSTIFAPEFSVMDTVNAVRGLVDTYSVLYPQLQDVDLRREVPELEVPVTVVMGRHEARGRIEPAREWFDALAAPSKQWVVFDGSSHRANFERPADYTTLLTGVVSQSSADPATGDSLPGR